MLLICWICFMFSWGINIWSSGFLIWQCNWAGWCFGMIDFGLKVWDFVCGLIQPLLLDSKPDELMLHFNSVGNLTRNPWILWKLFSLLRQQLVMWESESCSSLILKLAVTSIWSCPGRQNPLLLLHFIFGFSQIIWISRWYSVMPDMGSRFLDLIVCGSESFLYVSKVDELIAMFSLEREHQSPAGTGGIWSTLSHSLPVSTFGEDETNPGPMNPIGLVQGVSHIHHWILS